MTAGRIAFLLLVLGNLIQAVAIGIGGAVYPGYDHLYQYISELGATGAVTGPAVSRLGFVPAGIVIALGCLIAAWVSRRSGLAVAVWLLLGWYGVSLTAAGVYPCEFECARAEPTFNALMHDLFGGTGYLTAIIGIALGGFVAGVQGRRWLVGLSVVCTAVTVVAFWGVIAETEPGGLIQRALEGAIVVFTLALGGGLMRPAKAVGS
jgi:hypothetical membrane protein